MSERPSSLIQRSVDLLILRALQQESAAHGYSISRFVRARSEGALTLEDAALYQALHRLESRGLVESEWGVSENNRRAKFYRLTADGRARLRRESSSWKKYAQAMLRILDDPEGLS
jgi:PadR family transcriptional regulator PadR